MCLHREDGSGCWGRVVGESEVNTADGQKECFILSERYIRSNIGKTSRVSWETMLRKDQVDLERDVCDVRDFLKGADEGEILKALLRGKCVNGNMDGMSLSEMGLQSMLDGSGEAVLREELEGRM